jgi:hydroxyacylglutathione hydrolase
MLSVNKSMNKWYIRYCILIFLIISTGCGKQKNEWYVIEKIDDRTYIISEPGSSQGNSSFLIMGSDEAILFDSGTGENQSESIIQVVRSLTELPLTLLLSHFHFDHIGNISDFNSIGIPGIQLLKNRMSIDSLLYLTNHETFNKGTVSLKISRLFTIEEDIDLGDRKIKILHTPGHADESISIIDNENGFVFTGDLIYNGLLLFDDCNAYLNSINEILDKSEPDHRVFGSHGKPEVNYEKLIELKKAIEYYLTDSCSVKPVCQINFFGSTKDIYKIGDISFIDGYTDVFN